MNRRDAMKSLAAAALAPAAMPHAQFMRDAKPKVPDVVCCTECRPVSWTIEMLCDNKLVWKSTEHDVADRGNGLYAVDVPQIGLPVEKWIEVKVT